jgi:hypothetical protein
MTREELLRLSVLMSIADDYEEPVHVYGCVEGDFGLCGLPVSPGDTQKALIELTESGLAKAYYLGPGPVKELEGIPPFDGSGSYYFLITDDGRRSLAEWRKDWPFDDEGELIPGWAGLSD